MPDCGVVLQSAPTIRRLTRFPCKLFLCLAGFFAGETRETKLVRSSFFFFLLFFFQLSWKRRIDLWKPKKVASHEERKRDS